MYCGPGPNLLAVKAAALRVGNNAIETASNEAVRLGFATAEIPCPKSWAWLMRKPILNGLDVWMIFKLFIVMPLSSIYLVWQVRLLQKYRLPADIQKMTVFSSGIAAKAKDAAAAKALVKYITAPEAASAYKKRGMEPG